MIPTTLAKHRRDRCGQCCIGRQNPGSMLGEHVAFDILAWLVALATAWGVWRWRLADAMNQLTGKLGKGYFIALAAGGIIGAWLLGSLNLYLSGQPGLGRSILGGLTRRGVETIVTGLRWRAVQEALICRGEWKEAL